MECHHRTSSSDLPLWEAETGKLLFTYQGHSDRVWWVGWSPDGRRIASASVDKTVQVWDALTGKHPFIYRGHSGKVYALAWSPDGKRIASAGEDETVQVWASNLQ
jgi:WD40 repeat protein